MARILDLALKISADGGGVPARLTPVERALKSLEDQSAKVSKVFEQFAGTSDAAARAQSQTSESLRALREQLASGAITAQQFAERFNELSDAANAQAESFRRAAEITEQNISPLQRYERTFAELTQFLREGKISQETYNSAVEKARRAYDSATGGASNFEKAVAGQTLKFNELSGIFAALPGPLGNIAGRFSGLASAGEGLARIFSGGLQQGLTSIVSSIGALINPFTLALAGIAAFGAAAVAVVNGLSQLDERIEKLGNTAEKLGVSFEFIQTLDEAARRSGTSIDAVSAAFGRLQKSVLGVDEESKAAQKALAEIGVTAEELQTLSPEDQYQRIGSALAAIEDPARRTATATALFGRAGSDLIPFFNNIDKAANDMQRFGATISDVDRARIDSLGDSFDGVGVAIQALGQSVLLPFAGVVEGVAKALSGIINIVTAVAQVIGAVLGPVLDAIGAAFGVFGDAVNGTIGFFRSFFGAAEETAAATGAVAESVELSAEQAKELSKAIGEGDKALDQAIAKAGEFGQAGFEAALEFQTALEDLREQAENNELNAEQYARGVALATSEYEKQIEVAKQVADENRRLAEEAQRRAEAEAAAVQQIIDKNLEQIRIDEEFGGDSKRAQAADNLLRLQEEQIRIEEQLAAARAAGDQAAIDAATSRLATIDQVAARERDIASGAAAERERAAKAAEDQRKEAERAEQERQREIERVNEQIADATQKFAERQFEIEKERAEELGRIRSGSIEVQDIRSGGISAFFDALEEDPALGEARKQTKELQGLRKDIVRLQGQKAEILEGAL